MLLIFPFLAWLAPMASLVMTGMLWRAGDLSARGAALALTGFAIAGYAQFFGRSAAVSAVALALQTLLAIGLIVRWRFTAP